jgi:hypothetical protein
MNYAAKLAAQLKLQETEAEERRAIEYGCALARYDRRDEFFLTEWGTTKPELLKGLKLGELVHVYADGRIKRQRRVWAPEYGEVPTLCAGMMRLKILYPHLLR